MKIKLILLAFITAASAWAEPVKIKFNDLVELNSALHALDGIEKPVQTSDQGTRIIRTPLDMKAAARIAIAKDISAVRLALDAFEQLRQQLLQKTSPGAIQKIQTDMELLAKFSTLWNDAIREPVTIDAALLTEDQLNLDANKEITGAVLAGLSPVLKK